YLRYTLIFLNALKFWSYGVFSWRRKDCHDEGRRLDHFPLCFSDVIIVKAWNCALERVRFSPPPSLLPPPSSCIPLFISSLFHKSYIK
ncbi:uncharacterized, partial [Tachysurus ichikawai]